MSEKSSKSDPNRLEPTAVEVPTPTAWPMITAFGLTLLFAGLITNMIVSVVGLVCGVAGAIGWFRDVFPHPREEAVPVRPEAERAAAPTTQGRTVAHLKAGVKGHRVKIPVEIHPYSAGILGGLAGAAAMAVLALAYGLIAEGSIWYPINLLAAAGMPSMAAADLETLKSFSALAFVLATVVHLLFSGLVGLLYTVMLPMLPRGKEWLWGGIIAPLVWTAMLYPVMDIVDPALAERVPWIWFVLCQVAFGMVAGFVVYKSEKVETMQTWPLADRVGLERGREEEE